MKYLVLLLFVACAQSQLKLNLSYVFPFKEFSEVTKINEGLRSVSISSVVDRRENTNAIGEARTGVGYNKTPVIIGDSVESYVQSYMKNALVDRGIAINDHDGVKLDIIINELWVEELIEKYQPEKAKCKANITFNSVDNKRTWNGNYWAEIISPGDLADGTEKIAPTLASCMNDIVEKLVKDKTFIKYLE